MSLGSQSSGIRPVVIPRSEPSACSKLLFRTCVGLLIISLALPLIYLLTPEETLVQGLISFGIRPSGPAGSINSTSAVWLWTRYQKGDAQSNFAAQFDWSWSRLGPRINESMVPRTVYVKTDYLTSFFKDIVPKISDDHPVILATGDSDYSSPCDDLTPNCRYLDLADSPKILHWFAENMDMRHPKISPFPIGINTHGNGDVQVFNQIRLSMPTNRQKAVKAFGNFQFNPNDCRRYSSCRSRVHEKLKSKPWMYFVPNRLSETDSWKKHAEFAFVISPHGNGLDCFRTWEAILLNCIVIVEESTLDPIYHGFPVVIVKDFSAITEDNLNTWHAMFRDSFTDEMKSRLLMSSWVSRISNWPNEEATWKG